MSVLLDPRENFDSFIEKRDPEEYSEQVKREIKLLKASHNGEIFPFGSASYRIQKYPSDIDILEVFDPYGKKMDTVKAFETAIVNIVSNVRSNKDHYYSEIKAGLDKRYYFPIGILKNGRFQIDKLFWHKTKKLYVKGLLLDEDLRLMSDAMTKYKTSYNTYDILKFVMRQYYILRWSEDEIRSGEKKLRGGVTKTLKEAIGDDTLLKIDEITLINGKFTEITNTYYLFYQEGDEFIPINKSNDLYESLPVDIERLCYSDMFYNPFKAIKRMFALSRAPKNVVKPEFQNLLMKLFPFISSTTSFLYQTKSELDSISILIDKYDMQNDPKINANIDAMKTQLGTVLEIKKDKLRQLHALIDTIVKETDKMPKLALIDHLNREIKRNINYQTIYFLNDVHLNPLPAFVLPPVASYSWRILEPTFDPINPLDRL